MDRIVFVTRSNKMSGKGHLMRVIRHAELLSKTRNCVIVVDEAALKNLAKIGKYQLLSFDAANPKYFVEFLGLGKSDIIWFDVPDHDYQVISNFRDVISPLVSTNMFEKLDEERFEDIGIFPSFDQPRCYKIGGCRNTSQHSGVNCLSVPEEFFLEENRQKEDFILITMGGTDPMGFSVLLLEMLSLTKVNLPIKFILPETFPKKDLKTINQLPASVTFFDFGELDFPNELKNAKIAVINGGMTRYECIASNTFFIALSIDKKQYNLTEKVTKFGYGHNFGVFKQSKISSLNACLAELELSVGSFPLNKKIDGPKLRRDSSTLVFDSVFESLNSEKE